MTTTMKCMHKIGLTLAAMLLISFNAVAQGYAPPPAQVEVVKAETRMMAPHMDANGTVVSLNNAAISAEVEGPITWLASIGTKVAKGDVIARIDDRLLAVAERRARADVARLRADLVFRDADVKRFSELANRDVASQSRLDSVVAEREKTNQQIKDAEAVLDKAIGDLARTQIRAPFAGHVVMRLANVGEYAKIGDRIIRLVDTENLEVAIAAPLNIRAFLKAGTPVAVRTNVDVQMLPIRTVVPVGEQTSRMMEVRLSMPADSWIVGTAVSVILPKGEAKNAVTVPRDAIILKGSSLFVYRIKADNTAEQIRVEIDAAIGEWVSLKGGIAEGDQVVVRGGERLQNGGAVIVKGA